MTELLSIAPHRPSGVAVLLTGETGTGKEVLARAIHRASGRAASRSCRSTAPPCRARCSRASCSATARAPSPAPTRPFDGVIRAAAGGTLFLDEIAEIGPELQPKLLRFLETHEVHGLGDAQPVKVDVRIIAATNADLDAWSPRDVPRRPLLPPQRRPSPVPPLRERREEIPPLVDHYLRKSADEQKRDGSRWTTRRSSTWSSTLARQRAPAGQRGQPDRRLRRPDSTITPALLSPEIQASRRTVRVQPGDAPEISVRLDQPLNDAIETIERMMVLRALERAHGNYENAAKLLGISRKGLFLKRRRWGMQRAS